MNEDVKKTEGSNTNATLRGGVEMPAVYVDGRSEMVFVKEMPVKAYPDLFEAMQDEHRQLELYCERPAGWAATLTPLTFNELMETAERLNKEPFFGWSRRRLEKMFRLAPKETIEEIMRKATANLSPFLNGSPKSPSTAGSTRT